MQRKSPRVWLIVGDKSGDNAQVRAIAEALGWPVEWKVLHFKPPYVKGKPKVGASLHHVDLTRSGSLAPPWPDLIITVGRRPIMAALWVKRQAGGKTKIVLLGRPKRGFDPYDLILAPLQYRLPPHPKLISMGLPLLFPPLEKIKAAKEIWQPRLASMARPLVAVLVGGATRPYRFDRRVAQDVIAKSRALAGQGSLYFCASRRTSPEVLAELRRSGAPVYGWEDGVQDNPYLGLLGLADAFVVTGDSVSMMVEVARLGKPLAIYPLPIKYPRLHAVYRWLIEHGLYRSEPGAFGSRLARWAFAAGLIGYLRELERVHLYLYDHKLALPLDGEAGISKSQLDEWAPQGEAIDVLPEVTDRIRGLFK
ncbi:MAG: mitochondrial fission ELM1 family protein [Methylohalobius sp. ZOD2]